MFIQKALLLTTKRDEVYLRKLCAHVEKHLFLPEGFVEVMFNEKDAEDTKRGCFNAHYNAYNYMVKNNIERCLILEDDVYFMRSVKEEKYAPFLEENSWDVFYFGHKPDIRQSTMIRKTDKSNILEVVTNDRHAYIMHLPFARKTAALPWKGIFGDRLLRRTAEKGYALFPMAAIQVGPLFTPSFYNGITEKFSEYYRFILKRPFSLWDALIYFIKFIFEMPWVVIRSSFLAFRRN